MYRTHTCNQPSEALVGNTITLAGWAFRIRNFGALTFIDLRDRYGITQLVFDANDNQELATQCQAITRETVISVTGVLRLRSNPNPALPTGMVELLVHQLDILNPSQLPPFTLEVNTDGNEEMRLQYRYIDLRREPMRNAIMLRAQLAKATRSFLDSHSFLEIETPFLVKSTPEGARDFLVPSRIHPGHAYALPQSPQIFKQLFMMSGFDRYFQIVKCFRDEDFRADRQPEFTQIDCELSFTTQEEIIQIFTAFVRHIFQEVIQVELGDIPTMTYDHAFALYGSDKPDTRFEMQLQSVATLFQNTIFPPFQQAVAAEQSIAALVAPSAGEWTRRQIDALVDMAKAKGLSGLIWVKHGADGSLKSSADKFFDQDLLQSLVAHLQAPADSLILLATGEYKILHKAMGDIRLELGSQLGLRRQDKFAALWVVDFPMFAWDENSASWTFEHHPFTSPTTADFDKIFSDPGSVKANAYDFVLNGKECCSGSIRIHNADQQLKIFHALGMSDEEAQDKFGFLLTALRHGAPPHGGCAFGFDRLAAIMCGTDSIRDVIPFPKNNAGVDLMLESPSTIPLEQWQALHLQPSILEQQQF